MMLEFLGEADAAARIAQAVSDPTGLAGTTAEIGDTIAGRV
jgi:isocitrate/isopropylmalate dehydrogenase